MSLTDLPTELKWIIADFVSCNPPSLLDDGTISSPIRDLIAFSSINRSFRANFWPSKVDSYQRRERRLVDQAIKTEFPDFEPKWILAVLHINNSCYYVHPAWDHGRLFTMLESDALATSQSVQGGVYTFEKGDYMAMKALTDLFRWKWLKNGSPIWDHSLTDAENMEQFLFWIIARHVRCKWSAFGTTNRFFDPHPGDRACKRPTGGQLQYHTHYDCEFWESPLRNGYYGELFPTLLKNGIRWSYNSFMVWINDIMDMYQRVSTRRHSTIKMNPYLMEGARPSYWFHLILRGKHALKYDDRRLEVLRSDFPENDFEVAEESYGAPYWKYNSIKEGEKPGRFQGWFVIPTPPPLPIPATVPAQATAPAPVQSTTATQDTTTPN